MKVIFMGTPDFAVSTVDAIKANGHEVVLVVTQPDKPRGRSGKLAYSPVKEWALENNVAIFQPQKIKNENSLAYLKTIDADITVVAAYGQILPETILNLHKYGCINVHASLLPKYRGAAPIQWAILNGDDKTGITIMQMGVGLDDGDILLTKEVPLDNTKTGGSLFDELAEIGGQEAVRALDLIQKGEIVKVPQDESKATRVGMINKSLGEIDFNNQAVVIERYIRGLNPWPSAYTRLNGKNLKIWKASVISDYSTLDYLSDKDLDKFSPGEVCFVNKNSLFVVTGDGILSLEEIQLEGKKRMDISSFLLGRSIDVGTKLG